MENNKFVLAILLGVLFSLNGNLLIASFFNIFSSVEFPELNRAILNFLLLLDSSLLMIYLVKWTLRLAN